MRVLTVGGAMIDTIAIIESAAIERMSLMNQGASFLLLEEGRKTEAIEVSTHCGGGAVNAAVAFARLGLEASTLIKLGRDRRAAQILARLAEEGISCNWVQQAPSAPTGASVHVSSHDRNAAVFTFRGANTLLEPDDLADAAFKTDLVYIANLSNEAARCFPVIVDKAKSCGALVAANPGIRQLNERGGDFQATMPSIDILSLNRREAEQVLSLLTPDETEPDEIAEACVADIPNAPPLAQRGLKFESRRAGIASFFRALHGRGVKCVVLTDGRDGAFAATAGRLLFCPAHEAIVAGTAGAGDAFASTFSAYVAMGETVETALHAASRNAASVLAFVDTQSGLLDRDALRSGNTPTSNVIEYGM